MSLQQQLNSECPVTSAMPSASPDPRAVIVPSSGYLWSSGPRAQASTGTCSLSARPQMNMPKLEEARLFMQAMDYNRTTWKDDDGDT